jgi:hypothetical protein
MGKREGSSNGVERRGEEREEAMVSDERRGHMREKLPQLKGGE